MHAAWSGRIEVAKAPIDIRSLARAHTTLAINTLAAIARGGESEVARVNASCALLDRGWGKAPTTITGEDGEGAIQVIVRHIVEGVAQRTGEPRVVNQGTAQRQIAQQIEGPKA